MLVFFVVWKVSKSKSVKKCLGKCPDKFRKKIWETYPGGNVLEISKKFHEMFKERPKKFPSNAVEMSRRNLEMPYAQTLVVV